MRADTAGPRTWLLGAVALWAICVWGLALFGLGGKVGRLPEDATLAGRLPPQVPPAAERLGPLQQYASIGDRPLFTDDRRPQPFSINPEGDAAAAPTFDYVLTSVMRTPNFEMAILQTPDGSGEPIRIKVGGAPDAAPNWHLTALDARSATFNGPDGERKLDLRVFDGNGGQPPTAMTVRQPQQAANPGNNGASAPVVQGGVAMPPRPGQPARTPVATNPAAAQADAAATNDPAQSGQQEKAAQEQIEAIRKRIEARRAKLRADSQPTGTPGQNP